MVKSTKKHRIWFAVLRAALFAVFVYLFYRQIAQSNISVGALHVVEVIPLLILIALVPLNWWMEYLKWKSLLQFCEVRSSAEVRRSSFFAGIVTGMLTPNMLGNFVGRMYYFRTRDRIAVTMMTLVTSFSQFLVSILFGIMSAIILLKTPLGELDLYYLVIPALIILILLGAYFNFDKLIRFSLPRWYRFIFRQGQQKRSSQFAVYMIALGILRHFIFTLQMYLALKAFGGNPGPELVWWIWQYYFWLTLAPSLFLGKFVVRDSVALWVLGFAGLASVAIVPASLFIWTLNLLLPTLLALFLIKQKS